MNIVLKTLLVFCLVLNTFASDTELIQVIVLTRHGDRTPTKVFPKSQSVWSEGLGQLTHIGMKQHYELGQLYRKIYVEDMNFINNTYRANEVFARSTPKERTLMSAHSFMTGFFPPGTGPSTLPGAIQPVPIFSTDKSNDNVLYAYKNCPKLKLLTKEVEALEEWAQQKLEHSELFKELTEIFGRTIGLKETSSIMHLVEGETIHNRTRLERFTSAMLKKVKNIAHWVLKRKFHYREMGRLGAGNLVKEQLKERFEKARMAHQQKKHLDHRFVLFSGHDGTILALLSALNLNHLDVPKYAAHIAFELHYSHLDKDYHLIMKYNGEHVDYPSCGVQCPVEKFYNLTVDSIPIDWVQECSIESGWLTTFQPVHIISLTIGFLSGILLMMLCNRRKSSVAHEKKD